MNKFVEIIKNEAKKQNLNSYIVGGPVRDLILKREVKDYDFLIEGSAINFAKNAGFKIKSVHEAFNTVKVLIDETEIDIASTRTETYPLNGCLPDVVEIGVKIEEDLKRRDFTINSIALNLATGEFIDPFFGREDIKNKTLKILHKNSFKDDPTRILRGLDFKYRLGFDFDKSTFDLALECTKNYDRAGLSIDRIYLTLNKIFSSENADKILDDILKYEFYKIWANRAEIKRDEICELDCAIEHFCGAEKNKLYIMALEAIPYPKAHLNDRFEVFEFFKKFSKNALCFYYFKTKDENALEYLKIKDIKPLLNGDEIISLGYSEGEIIGKILNSLLKEKILNPEKLKTKEDEIQFVKKFF